MAPSDDVPREILAGVLALREGMITRDQLVAALAAWDGPEARPLMELLADGGTMPPDRRTRLDTLVAEAGSILSGWPGGDGEAGSTIEEPQTPWPGRSVASTLAGPEATDLFNVSGAGSTYVMPERSAGGDSGPVVGDGGRFRVLRPHARGGLGAVSIAMDGELNREVALKQILDHRADEPFTRRRFVMEAKVTGGLEHPGIVPVYSLGSDEAGRPYYAMRFVRGISLEEAIRRFHSDAPVQKDPGRRSLALRGLLARFLDVCDAIDYAHSRGVLHRDLKPSNVMLGPYGETLVVDWGLAKMIGQASEEREATEPVLAVDPDSLEELTSMGQRVGTPSFMSPEQAGGRAAELGPPSDVYSLGATLYPLLTGRSAFYAYDLADLLRKVERGEFPPPRKVRAWVDRPLEAICLKAMALKPADRYGSARALAEDIRLWLADEPVSAWREPPARRALRWARRNRTLVTSSAAATLVGLSAFGYALYQSRIYLEERRVAAEGRVAALGTAEVRALPRIVEELGVDLTLARGSLEALARGDGSGSASDDRRRFRGELALLPGEPGRAGSLAAYARRPEAGPDVVLVVRDALAKHAPAPRLVASFRRDLEATADGGLTDGQLRSAGVLARLAEPEDRLWDVLAVPLARKIVLENPLRIDDWREVFQPVSNHLAGPLLAIAADPTQAERRDLALTLLFEFADQPSNPTRAEDLAALLTEAPPAPAGQILARLARPSDRSRAVAHLAPMLDPVARFDGRRAVRQGRVALALIRLGEAARVLPLFAHSDDPSVRTELIHGASSYGVDPAWVIARLREEADVSTRRSWVLCLGTYPPAAIPEAERRSLVDLLLGWYRSDPDPGVHGAVDWLLGRRWGEEPALEATARSLASPGPTPERGWYVNGQGQTFTVVRGPVESRMGSTPQGDLDRQSDERPHDRLIPRSFAVAARELTAAEYGRFLDEKPPGVSDPRSTPRFKVNISTPDCANAEANWFEVARYCNWLSALEGIPEGEWCYPREVGPGMRLPEDHLERTGYRLPTEAEWEYACRAGTVSARSHGQVESRLRAYAWYLGDPDRTGLAGPLNANVMHGVARKMPNDLGLFDCLGNAFEWCVDPTEAGEKAPARAGREDRLMALDVSEKWPRMLKGGAFNSPPAQLRSAAHISSPPDYSVMVFGLRLFRTIR